MAVTRNEENYVLRGFSVLITTWCWYDSDYRKLDERSLYRYVGVSNDRAFVFHSSRIEKNTGT